MGIIMGPASGPVALIEVCTPKSADSYTSNHSNFIVFQLDSCSKLFVDDIFLLLAIYLKPFHRTRGGSHLSCSRFMAMFVQLVCLALISKDPVNTLHQKEHHGIQSKAALLIAEILHHPLMMHAVVH